MWAKGGLVILVLVWSGVGSRGDDFFLKDGERVVFFGDSITQAGGYVNDVEAFLMTRYPDKSFTIINHGISSETLSGTSEPDHDPPRPCALDRFARDVTAWNPDVVVACFGMNDGNYRPPNAESQAAFEVGVRRLIELVRTQTKARLVLLTPPPFDAYRRQVGDPDAEHFGYKFPAVDYNDALRDFRAFEMKLREPGVSVVDVWTHLNAALLAGRKVRASYHVAPDGVHPNETGHALMAGAVLLSWKGRDALNLVDHATVDAARGMALGCAVEGVERYEHGVRFQWTTKIPWRLSDAVDEAAMARLGVPEKLNSHRLRVVGLPEARYRILVREEGAAGVEVSRVTTSEEIGGERGLEVDEWGEFPANLVSRSLREGVEERNRLRYAAWRRAIATEVSDDDRAVNEDDAARTARLRWLALPKRLLVDLQRLPEID